jgi:large subunit ribosomal protein L28
MAKCEKTGRQRRTGNTVSHANNKNKRVFGANIQKVKVLDENGVSRRAHVSAKAIKSNMVEKRAPRRVLLALQKAEQEQA